MGAPSTRARVVHSRPPAAASMKASGTRTLWLAFWNCTES